MLFAERLLKEYQTILGSYALLGLSALKSPVVCFVWMIIEIDFFISQVLTIQLPNKF